MSVKWELIKEARLKKIVRCRYAYAGNHNDWNWAEIWPCLFSQRHFTYPSINHFSFWHSGTCSVKRKNLFSIRLPHPQRYLSSDGWPIYITLTGCRKERWHCQKANCYTFYSLASMIKSRRIRILQHIMNLHLVKWKGQPSDRRQWLNMTLHYNAVLENKIQLKLFGWKMFHHMQVFFQEKNVDLAGLKHSRKGQFSFISSPGN